MEALNDTEIEAINGITFNSNVPQIEDRPYILEEICIEGCTRTRTRNKKDDYEYVRCCLCTKWFHALCLKLPQEEIVGVWACVKCRYIADEVAEMRKLNQKLILQNNQILKLLMEQQKQTQQSVTSQTLNTDTLATLRRDLHDFTTHVTPELYSDSDSDTDSDEEEEPEGHYLCGDSLLTNVNPTKHGLVINYVSGAKYVDIKKRIQKIKNKKYNDMTIVCGTNDSATKKPVEKIIQECKDMITVAKAKAVKVHLSSILPRSDDRADMVKIDTLNQMITILANEEGVEFINNDKNFRYRDDTIDEHMLLPADNLHLTDAGITRLLKNLGLSNMAESKLGKGPTNKWQHSSPPGQGMSKAASQAPRQAPTKPLSTLQPIRHRTNPTTSRQQQQWSRKEPWSSSQHVPPPPPPPPPRHHTSSASYVYQPVHQPSSPTITGRQHGQSGGDRPWSHKASVQPPNRFRGEHDIFSNFYACGIIVNGLWFPTAEHAYQHRKSIEMNDMECAEYILNSVTPQDAKHYGNQVTTDDYWHNIKQGVMYEILHEKYKQCPEFAQRLLDSAGQVVIEATNNEFWAEGKSGKGQNILGHLLMALRDEICGVGVLSSPHHTRRPATRDNQPACFYCGETGHVTHRCRWQGPIRCHNCSQLGHKAKLCTK